MSISVSYSATWCVTLMAYRSRNCNGILYLDMVATAPFDEAPATTDGKR
ncbi:MAG: hypothetical protein ACT6RN_24495 [Agrobacterium sp.]